MKYNSKFLKSHTFYRMRLQVFRRYNKPIYKIVVVNSRNRIVYTLGYYNPFKINFRSTYKILSKADFTAKIISIDRKNTIIWLNHGVIPSLFLSYILNDMGLLKTHLSFDSDSSHVSFQNFRSEIHQFLPFLFQNL